MELWTNSAAESLSVRVTQSTQSTTKCLGDRVMDGLKIPRGQWNHLAVNCHVTQPSAAAAPDGSGSSANWTVHVDAILNGYQTAGLRLHVPLPLPSKRNNSHSFLLIGIARQSEPRRDRADAPPRCCCCCCWYMGHVTLFKGAILNAEQAILLTAVGSDRVFLAGCQSGDATDDQQLTPNLVRVLSQSKQMVRQANVDWPLVFHGAHLTRALQQNVILTYSSHRPDCVFIYPSIITPAAGD